MTKKMVANRGWLAAFAASTLVAIIGALAFASMAAAAGPTISLSADHPTVAPGGTVKVSVNAAGSGADAAFSIRGSVSYDTAKLTPTACTPVNTCNTALSANTVGIAVLSTDALSGTVASVTFTVASGASGTANVGLTLIDCTNEGGDSRTDCTANGTAITIAEATATASPSPSAVAATPTATVGAFQNTGGAPSDGSSSALPLALAALGLVTIGGAAWAVARTRRIAG